jgi:hypothetical protein
MIESFKEAPCMDCGVSYPAYVLEFDHRPEEDKSFNVSNGVVYGRKALLREIAKCDIVCANCHKTRTHNRKDGLGV